MSNDCPRFNKWIRGCNFEPRYSMSPSTMQFTGSVVLDGDVMLAEQYRTITYVRDVCTACGKAVEREGSKPNG